MFCKYEPGVSGRSAECFARRERTLQRYLARGLLDIVAPTGDPTFLKVDTGFLDRMIPHSVILLFVLELHRRRFVLRNGQSAHRPAQSRASPSTLQLVIQPPGHRDATHWAPQHLRCRGAERLCNMMWTWRIPLSRAAKLKRTAAWTAVGRHPASHDRSACSYRSSDSAETSNFYLLLPVSIADVIVV